MKKQYISPETTVMLLDTRLHLMAVSGDTETTVTLKEEYVDDETEGFVQGSRSYRSLWDEEEEY